MLTVLVPFIGYPRTLNGLAAVNDITAQLGTNNEEHDMDTDRRAGPGCR